LNAVAARLLLLLAACLLHAWAPPLLAATPLSFSELGVNRGLDARVISSVLVDRQGFLWIGSRTGLYRYDGYEALRFTPDPGDPHSIADTDIRYLYEARDGGLWIATNTGGLSRLDPGTGRFRNFRRDPEDPATLSYDSVYGLTEDAEGRLWVGTQSGLNRLDPETGIFERFMHDPDDARSLPADFVYPVLTDSAGSLWIGTVGGGLARWDPQRQDFERFDLAAATGNSADHNDVFALADSGDGRIWVATRAGLIRIDAASLAVEEIPIEPGGPDTLTALEFDEDGLLWIGRLAAGVTVYDTGTGESWLSNPDSLGSPGQLPAVPQLGLERAGGQLFVATYDGLFMANARPDPFRTLGAGPGAGTLAQFNVTALHLDPLTDRLWTGTFGGGVQLLDRVSLRAEPPLQGIGPGGILSIESLADGRLFAGANTGLWEIEASGSARFHAHVADKADQLGPGYVVSLLAENEGPLWIGIGGSGLFRLDQDVPGFVPSGPAPGGTGNPGGLSGDYITALLQTGLNNLWVGTRSNGLNRCSLDPWECIPFSTDTVPALQHHNVTDLLVDRSGHMWIGTDGGGLHRALLGDEGDIVGFEHFGENEGLINAGVMAILEDTDGSLWISTRGGITRLDPATGRTASYVSASGLPVTEFNARAKARDQDTLFFGGLGGVVAHPAAAPFPRRDPTPVRITAVNRSPSGAAPEMRLSNPGHLQLPWREPFTVRFAVLDFAELPHVYAYRLGAGGEWVEHGRSREISFFALSPGHHELEIRGRDASGTWGPTERLAIEVVPPLWRTPWFLVLVGAWLALLLMAWHRLRMRTLEQKNLALTSLQQQRETALLEAEASRRELQEAYGGLRQLTQRLDSAKEEERRHISRELHDELGQTLTAAKISLQLLGRDNADPATASRLAESVAMMDSMIGQVRQISLSLRPPLLDELGLAAALEQFLYELSEHTGTPIDFNCGPGVTGNPAEVRTAIYRLVQEAVNNALRHAHARRIRVELDRDEDGTLRARIADDGGGFDLHSIRQRIHRGDHLGLLGMEERIRALGGEFKIVTAPGHGCTIEARIPAQ
jgi:signal transduction histidine kinase/ligand-binding sensor domain-containing protein